MEDNLCFIPSGTLNVSNICDVNILSINDTIDVNVVNVVGVTVLNDSIKIENARTIPRGEWDGPEPIPLYITSNPKNDPYNSPSDSIKVTGNVGVSGGVYVNGRVDVSGSRVDVSGSSVSISNVNDYDSTHASFIKNYVLAPFMVSVGVGLLNYAIISNMDSDSRGVSLFFGLGSLAGGCGFAYMSLGSNGGANSQQHAITAMWNVIVPVIGFVIPVIYGEISKLAGNRAVTGETATLLHNV